MCGSCYVCVVVVGATLFSAFPPRPLVSVTLGLAGIYLFSWTIVVKSDDGLGTLQTIAPALA